MSKGAKCIFGILLGAKRQFINLPVASSINTSNIVDAFLLKKRTM